MPTSNETVPNWSRLPEELLEMIIQFVQVGGSLMPLSEVNKLFRRLCAPILFQTLRVTFSMAGLDRLSQASQSSICPYVKTICYVASELVDPLAQKWNSFRACVYTPVEYARNQRDHWWTSNGHDISYSNIFLYFQRMSHEQQAINQSLWDLKILCTCLPCFPHLDTLRIWFRDAIEPPFYALADRVLLDGRFCFLDHLEKVATALIMAKEYGLCIRTVEIRGFYPDKLSDTSHLTSLLNDAFTDIYKLQLYESPAALEFFTHNPLPYLRQLELGSYWMCVPGLESFVRTHARSLRTLCLEDIWLLQERRDDRGIHLSTADTETILGNIRHICDLGILQELTMNRRDTGQWEIHRKFDN